MALKRLTRDHPNMHKRHFFIGDAMAVIVAPSNGRSTSETMIDLWLRSAEQSRFTFWLHSARSRTDGCQASGTGQTFCATVTCISGGHESLRNV